MNIKRILSIGIIAVIAGMIVLGSTNVLARGSSSGTSTLNLSGYVTDTTGSIKLKDVQVLATSTLGSYSAKTDKNGKYTLKKVKYDSSAGTSYAFTFTKTDYTTNPPFSNQIVTKSTKLPTATMSQTTTTPAPKQFESSLTSIDNNPTGFSAASWTLNWKDDLSNETGFVVEIDHSTPSRIVWDSVATLSANKISYTVSSPGRYRIKANLPSSSLLTNEVISATPSSINQSTTVGSFSITTLSQISPTQVNISWNKPSNGGGYKVERIPNTVSSTNLSSIATLPSDTLTYEDNTVTAGTAYTYRIRANGSGFSSSYSYTPQKSITVTGTTGGTGTDGTGTVSGKITFDNQPPQIEDGYQMKIAFSDLSSNSIQETVVKSDGTFTISLPPARYISEVIVTPSNSQQVTVRYEPESGSGYFIDVINGKTTEYTLNNPVPQSNNSQSIQL